MAACINFSVFYLVGLPIGVCLALLTDLRTLGMWIGLSVASFTQVGINSWYQLLMSPLTLLCSLVCLLVSC